MDPVVHEASIKVMFTEGDKKYLVSAEAQSTPSSDMIQIRETMHGQQLVTTAACARALILALQIVLDATK